MNFPEDGCDCDPAFFFYLSLLLPSELRSLFLRPFFSLTEMHTLSSDDSHFISLANFYFQKIDLAGTYKRNNNIESQYPFEQQGVCNGT